jgi:hypothetical protein
MRFFYNYKIWECPKSNFYKGIAKNDETKALGIMKDYNKWGFYMKKLLDRWPVSCNQFLSDPTINKKAWIGQASMACFFKVSAATTKKCWFMLNKKEQNKANNEAGKVLNKWREKCQKSVQVSMF